MRIGERPIRKILSHLIWDFKALALKVQFLFTKDTPIDDPNKIISSLEQLVIINAILYLDKEKFKLSFISNTLFRVVHMGVRNFPCPHCDYRSINRVYLDTHIKNKHSGSI